MGAISPSPGSTPLGWRSLRFHCSRDFSNYEKESIMRYTIVEMPTLAVIERLAVLRRELAGHVETGEAFARPAVPVRRP